MKVLLVDDHALFVSGLENLLEASGIVVVGKVHDGDSAVEAAKKYQPDVVLMDIQMPGCDGLIATRRIKNEFPQIKIVMLTMTDEDELLFEAIKSGASGFLLKNIETEELLNLLSDLMKGETIFSPGLAERLLKEFDKVTNDNMLPHTKTKVKPLTPRQKEVLTHIAGGMTYKEVAVLLKISETTVKYHMNEILERLHLKNRAQAIVYAARNHLPDSKHK